MASPYQALYDQFVNQGAWQPAAPAVNWNPYTPPTSPDTSGGSGLSQWPSTPIPDNTSSERPSPGVSNTRQGAWGLPIEGILANFGMPTPPASQTAGGVENPPLTPNDFGYWTGQNAEVLGNWAQIMPQVLNLLQNASQFQQETGEGARRFDAEFGRNLGNDQFQRDLTTRQQQFQEAQAGFQNEFTQQQFAWQQENDRLAREVADRETSVLEGRLGLEESAQEWQRIYQQQMLGLEQARIDQQREAARYAAFGRAQAPAQWRGNWR